MHRTRSIDLHRGVPAYRICMGRTLAVVVTSGLVLMITVSLAFGAAVRAGIAPDFDQQIVLNTQHRLVIHNGPSPTCAFIPNPPQHDCFWPGPERREFSVDYVTPHGARSLVWFGLPAR
jgi:hypothetical protein